MIDFLASLGLFGWIVIALAAFGLATLPRALREMVSRPWKDVRGRGRDDVRPGADPPADRDPDD